MHKKIDLIFMALESIGLVSCVASPGTTNCTNRYPDFSSYKAAFDKGVNKYSKSSGQKATAFDVASIKEFEGFSSRITFLNFARTKRSSLISMTFVQTSYQIVAIPFYGTKA